MDAVGAHRWACAKREGGDQMGNANTDERQQELFEDEAALQRWTWEGGSPWDRFGVLDKIQAQLERRAMPGLRHVDAEATGV
jgi:hypothetical protein